jgi:hypothetical protein
MHAHAALLALTPHTSTLTALDWLAIGVYFGVLLGVAWWVVRRAKDAAADYFLAGRNLGWWVIGASIFASNIGSEHVVGLASSGTTDGAAMTTSLEGRSACWSAISRFSNSLTCWSAIGRISNSRSSPGRL